MVLFKILNNKLRINNIFFRCLALMIINLQKIEKEKEDIEVQADQEIEVEADHEVDLETENIIHHIPKLPRVIKERVNKYII